MSGTASKPHQDFRGDIQGLRALSVGLVILAHAGFRTFAGGFVGVDVFFVISGFLITSLLVREVARDQRISLLGFYARRARRILPAAVLVAVVTVVASTLLLPLLRAVEIAKDSVWAAFFAANIRFTEVGTDYFAKGEPSSPLQHYWSLSVEEQYYLVWPLLLVAWVALARSRGRTPLRRTVLVLLGVLSVASFVWSVVDTHQAPTAAYFSTLTRAWELGLGSAAALALSGRRPKAPRWLLETVSVLGLLAIVVATLTFGPRTPFPGYAALLPVLGATALLVTGAAEHRTGVARLLSVRPARLVGDWSYSLYLWHWPLLRIAEDRLHHPRLPLPTLALVLLLALALSAATYRFVEEPFRRGRFVAPPVRGVALYPMSLALVVAVALGGRVWVDRELGVSGDNPAITTAQYADQHLRKDPVAALVQASVLAAQDGQAVPSDLQPPLLGLRQDTASLGDCDYRTGTHRLCPEGDRTADRSIVLIGDSHARAWSPAIDRIGETEGYVVHDLVYSGCSATQAVQVEVDTQRAWSDCEDFKDWTIDTVRRLHPDLVIVATSAVSPIMAPGSSQVLGMVGERSAFEQTVVDGFGAELRLLAPLADRVVVLGDTPKLPREPGVCLSSGGVDLGDCLFRRGPVARTIQLRFAQAAREQDIPFVDASRWFCFRSLCPSVVGRTITMRDSEHMTPEYALQLARPLAGRLPLQASGSPS